MPRAKKLKSFEVSVTRVSDVIADDNKKGRFFAYFNVDGSDLRLPCGAESTPYLNELRKEETVALLKENPDAPEGWSLDLRPAKTSKKDIDAFVKTLKS